MARESKTMTERKAAALGWVVGDALQALPEPLRALVGPREGWTARGWADRLRRLAAACEGLHPRRAAELREASAVLEALNPEP